MPLMAVVAEAAAIEAAKNPGFFMVIVRRRNSCGVC